MKLKTNKTLAKRVKLTSTGKLLKRKAGQDHFNSRESGKVRRNKRRDIDVPKTLQKAIKNMLPYN
ncbi:50S ribosomal protein L35 [Patescibacteria group bacterium]|nr:50S ribosomal protein L35 [Patescibacteria group bacterium]